MKLLEVVTPTPAFYHGCSTRKTFWEEKFTPVKMTSCGSHDVRKHRGTNNDEQYIILDVSSKLDFLENMEATYSE